MTRYWMATSSLETAAWYFTKDGKVFVDPQAGFREEELAANAKRQGVAKVDGETMTIAWSGGKQTTSRIEKDGEAFSWDMGIFVPVQGFSNARELTGTWEGGHSVSSSAGGASTSRALELKDDGTFTGAGAATLTSKTSESTVNAGSSGSNAGGWKLDGYVLTLTYDDGRVTRGIAFPYDDEKTSVKPDRFYFSGLMYRKR